MKKIRILTTACLMIFGLAGNLTTHLEAQVYHPFPLSNAIWNSVGYNVFSLEEYEFRYGVTGDTVINSTTYAKVYNLFDTTLNHPMSTYFGAIREGGDKKVWLLMPGFEKTILYDFSAEVGDTIWYGIGGALCGDGWEIWPLSPHYKTVSSIDSILLETGEYRRQWHLTGPVMNDIWVEGIGSIYFYALFTPIISDFTLCGDGYSFACFKQDNVVLYLDNMNCGTCFCNPFLGLPGETLSSTHSIILYPNPATREVVVELASEPGICDYRIVAVTGKEVISGTADFITPKKISVKDLPPGQYFFIVSDKDCRRLGQKVFIIQ